MLSITRIYERESLPQSCPTFPESRQQGSQVWEEGAGPQEDRALPAHLNLRADPCSPAVPGPILLLILHPPLLLAPRSRKPEEGAERCQERERLVQAGEKPWETAPGGEGRDGLIPLRRLSPDSNHRGVGTRRGGPGGLPHPGQSPGAGLGGVSGGKQLGVGKGFPVCRPWPVPPVAPRQQQDRGGGSS